MCSCISFLFPYALGFWSYTVLDNWSHGLLVVSSFCIVWFAFVTGTYARYTLYADAACGSCCLRSFCGPALN